MNLLNIIQRMVSMLSTDILTFLKLLLGYMQQAKANLSLLMFSGQEWQTSSDDIINSPISSKYLSLDGSILLTINRMLAIMDISGLPKMEITCALLAMVAAPKKLGILFMESVSVFWIISFLTL